MQTYSMNLIKLLAENALEGVLVLDTNGLIRLANASASKMFNYQADELIGKHIALLTDEYNEHNFVIENLDSYSKNIFGIGNQYRGKQKDGSIFIFDLNIVDLNSDEGEKLFLYRLHDLSHFSSINLHQNNIANELMLSNTDLKNKLSKQAETEHQLRNDISELLKAIEFSKNLSEIKSVFVSTVSDNFRSPLSSILSSAQLISRYTKAEEQKNREKHIKKIESTINNLNTTLDELLTCKELEDNTVICKSEQFDFKELAKDVISESKLLINEEAVVNYEHESHNTNIISDQLMIRNIMGNLVSNAIKFSNGKAVQINSSFDDEKLILRVKDNGIGIPKIDQPHIFRRFFRASNANGTKGNGIGLCMVKKYLEKLDGHIQLNSEVDNGTEIILSVPAILVPAEIS
jgi:two-component system sensor kinase FixL